jgi:hypothetical protein
MKKYIIAAIVAAGYIALCRLSRGYWNISGDLIVIVMAAVAWAVLRVGLKRDHSAEEADEPTPIRIAKASGGISRSERCVK